jgi:hypothetical protein
MSGSTTSWTRWLAAIMATLTVLAIAATGCGSNDDNESSRTETTPTSAGDGTSTLPTGSEPVDLDPADFTTRIDNRYWPMAPDGKPGRKWIHVSEEERIEVIVTSKKKRVEGIEALVLRDTVTSRPGGELVEVTDDWYAQDREGNVWYLGEDTKEYENGEVASTSGSWEAGVDGAEAGIIMSADPGPGVTYRQEHYEGEAEDRAKVISIDETVKVPAGTFRNSLKTLETTPLEPSNKELKYYAPDVGPVLRTNEDGGGREELVSFRR